MLLVSALPSTWTKAGETLNQSVPANQVGARSQVASTLSIDQIPSPKRTAQDRTGVYSWVTYHAGFSPGFVSGVLEYLKLGPNSEVLDPFLGTGVTCVEAKVEVGYEGG